MADITLRSSLDRPLTNKEVDDNFNNLNLELGTKVPSITYTPADILTKLKTVDGVDSGLDADSLHGKKPHLAPPGALVVTQVLRQNDIASIVTSTYHGFVIGDIVNIFGVTPTSFNGTYTVTGVPSLDFFRCTQIGETSFPITNQTNGRVYKNITEASIPYRDITGTIYSSVLVAKTTYSNLVGDVTGNLTGNVTGNASNVSGVISISNGGTGGTTQSTARSNLGLGSLSLQNSNAVSITGGTITNLTNSLSILDGGTGANNVATARVNLGLGNVTNESKTTMFNNPVFTGTLSAPNIQAGVINTSGDIFDSKGNIRTLPTNSQNGPYTLTASDVGKSVIVGNTVTIPANVFSAGDIITIYNNLTAINVTINCSSVNTYIVGTNVKKTSLSLKFYGIATIFFVSSTFCIVSGSVS